MSATVTLGQLIGTYLRELVAQDLLPREGVAVLLENASQLEDLKERVPANDYGRLIAHLGLQRQQGLIKESVHDRLVIPLQSKLQPRAATKTIDFYAVPRPKVERYVCAVASFQGDEAQNQLSFEEGDVILVLHAKDGAEWALGERVDNGIRGLFPFDFTVANSAPRATAAAAAATAAPLSQQEQQDVPPTLRRVQTQEPAPSVSLRAMALSPRGVADAAPPASLVTPSAAGALSPRASAAAQPAAVAMASLRPATSSSLPSSAPPSVVTPAAAPSTASMRKSSVGSAAEVLVLSSRQPTNTGPRYAFIAEVWPPAKDKKKKEVASLQSWMLLRAAYEGDEKHFRLLLKQGVPREYRESVTGDSALICATFNKKTDFAKMLIRELLCLPSEVNNAGESALHYAVRNRDVALAECLIKHGADTMLRDDEGRKPMFMAPDKVFEKVMRDAEKKRKKILEPVLPPAKAAALADAEKARRAALVASAPAATQVSTREVAARQLVSMTAPDANTKAADPIKWNTLRGTSVGAYESDTVDVIHVFLDGGAKALEYPVKRNSSCSDCINYVTQKLMLTEWTRWLQLSLVDPKGYHIEIPDFKPVLTVKNSYGPSHRFVLELKKGAPRDTARDCVAAMEAINSH